MKKTVPLAIAIASVCVSLPAFALTIDGNLADWGINASTWQPTDTNIHYTVEDQVGSGSFYLSPGWGGQAYDAEAMYATISDDKLYVALATGHNPKTPNQPNSNSYGAGDFAIDFGKNGTFDLGINLKPFDSIAGNHPFENFGVAGGVYMNPGWAYGLWKADGSYTNPSAADYHPDLKHPTYMISGTQVGSAQLAYTTAPKTGYGVNQSAPHYFYEMSVDLSVLRAAHWDGQAFDIHWTENCANDSIQVDPPGAVPEPGSLALVGLALCGLLRRYHKKMVVAA